MSKRIKVALIIAVVVCILICMAVWVVLNNVKVENPVAEIILDGEVIREVPLTEDCEFTVDCETGYNVIAVKNGEICISSADCPDKVCVRTGAISNGAVPIVCLPHRLEIKIVSGSSEIDAQL